MLSKRRVNRGIRKILTSKSEKNAARTARVASRAARARARVPTDAATSAYVAAPVQPSTPPILTLPAQVVTADRPVPAPKRAAAKAKPRVRELTAAEQGRLARAKTDAEKRLAAAPRRAHTSEATTMWVPGQRTLTTRPPGGGSVTLGPVTTSADAYLASLGKPKKGNK